MAYDVINSRVMFNDNNIVGTIGRIYNENEVARLAEVHEENKYGVESPALRDYLKKSIEKTDGLAECAAWAKNYLINTIVSNPNFGKAYKSQTDLAEYLGYSKSAVSNAIVMVTLREELKKQQFGTGYTASQVQELVPEYNKHKKTATLDVFWDGLREIGLSNSMSCKSIRESVKDAFTYVTESKEVTTDKPETEADKPETEADKPETKADKPETKADKPETKKSKGKKKNPAGVDIITIMVHTEGGATASVEIKDYEMHRKLIELIGDPYKTAIVESIKKQYLKEDK